MRVPFFDLKAQNQALRAELDAAIGAVVSDAAFILGPAVERFERQFAEYIGVRHCVAVNNGTSALHLALLACGVGPGDEVITTPHTWISTSWAISYVGARPVFADIDPVTYTLSAEQARRAITPRTKAILPVHLYGRAADLDGLGALAEEFGVALVEDSAQAHGAKWRGRRVGGIGRAGCFSFYPSKNLGAFGEGGAVVADDDEVAARVRRLRDHSQARRHHHVEVGFNMRLEGLQGAVLSVKLPHLDGWNSARARLASLYASLLEGVPGLELPDQGPPGSHVWHLYVVLVPEGTREEVQARLAEEGVATGLHYPTPVHLQPAYAHLGHRPGDFPVAKDVARRCLSLPMYPEMTAEQVAAVAGAVRRVMEALAPVGSVR